MSKLSRNREGICISLPPNIKKHIKKNTSINFSRWVCQKYEQEFMKEENIMELQVRLAQLKDGIEITKEDIGWSKRFKKLGGDKILAQYTNYTNTIKKIKFEEFKKKIEKLAEIQKKNV